MGTGRALARGRRGPPPGGGTGVPSAPPGRRETFRPWFAASAGEEEELWLTAEGTGEPWFTGDGEGER